MGVLTSASAPSDFSNVLSVGLPLTVPRLFLMDVREGKNSTYFIPTVLAASGFKSRAGPYFESLGSIGHAPPDLVAHSS